ncbi:hypothetical protein FNV43_RR00386 [Rhamnella rubrinervis]|uniref:60S ribosome subunit biogenesis protein NIP7 pre-PUA domain-containing protein n=1 Tax=Rhamnella rubrinervis TaxID=2594499 RepID=A0A8K0HQI8_9ROSA|nr:hypothetical protein FNV43_RR00386 [Rhamnella rubrinervis]
MVMVGVLPGSGRGEAWWALVVEAPPRHALVVYYVSDSLVKRTTNIARANLVSLDTCIGKFTHGINFHLTVQALGIVAANAKHKVWLKPTSEMSFLYGNHVLKAKSTQDCRKLDPNGNVVLHQVDIGEYLRIEDEL